MPSCWLQLCIVKRQSLTSCPSLCAHTHLLAAAQASTSTAQAATPTAAAAATRARSLRPASGPPTTLASLIPPPTAAGTTATSTRGRRAAPTTPARGCVVLGFWCRDLGHWMRLTIAAHRFMRMLSCLSGKDVHVPVGWICGACNVNMFPSLSASFRTPSPAGGAAGRSATTATARTERAGATITAASSPTRPRCVFVL